MTNATPAGDTEVRMWPEFAGAAQIEITDPRDGSFVGRLHAASTDDLAAALAASRRAFEDWSRVPAAERGTCLRKAAGALDEHAAELAELNARETGRPTGEALGGIQAGADTLRQYSELGPVDRGTSLRGDPSAVDYTVRQPRGVVVALTPWNDPVAVASGLLGAALVSGDTVVHKPSERCPHLGERLGGVLADVLPDSVLITVTGDGSTGRELITLPGIDVIAHVGSTATGESIVRTAALTGAHVVRENGGNDALIVDSGVDATWAAQQAALGAFANSGQICTSVERIFVHRDLADEFTGALCAEARRLNDSGELGPLVDEALRDIVHGQVSASVAAGAQTEVGGVIPEGPGSFYPATVLSGCSVTMPVMTEETFGPVAPVHVVDSFEEALEVTIADRYGLSATVLTPSMEHAHRAAHDLPVGTVKVNDVFGGAPGGSAQPRRASGSGFGYGPELLNEMTTTKVVHIGLPTEAVRR